MNALQTDAGAPGRVDPPRLLVVEDDAIVARDVERSLEGMGYEVADVIRKGEWVLNAAREHRPDLVLMDIRLAGEMDGIEAAGEVLDELGVPVVYLTAYADEMTRRRVRETTPFGYVVKPFTDRDLRTTVEVALLHHRMEKELEAERSRLSERVKEQSCLYDVSRILHEGDEDLKERLQAVVDRIPAGWQHDDVTVACLRLGGETYVSDGFARARWSLRAPLEVGGDPVGEIVVGYLEERPEEDVGPFLVEERRLLDEIGDRVAGELERAEIQGQLRRLADIVESTSDFVGMVAADGRTLWVNRPGRRMLGIPEEEELGAAYLEDFAPGWAAERITSEGLPSAREEGVWEGETALLARDGREIPVSQVIVAHRDEGGEIAYFSTIARDVSRRERAERRLRESERRFRQMAETIEEVFWLRDPASEEMLYVSPAFEQIWGRPVEDLYEDARLWIRAVHPDDREELVAKALEGEGPEFEAEYRIVRPDGEVRWIRDRGFPVTDEDGEVYRVAGVARDVTERRDAYRSSERQKRTLSRILDTTAEGILITDAEGRFEYANPAAEEILGLSADEIRDESYRDARWRITGPEGGAFPDGQLPVARVLETREPVRGVEHGVERPDGGRVVLSVNAEPLLDASGELTGVVASVRDVTDRKQFEAELQRRALHDYLTGLPNRALFRDRLEHAFERVNRMGERLAVLFLDLKRFKVINDSLGHDAGDHVLREVARRLEGAIRSQDTVARMGGDEFTVLLEDVSDDADAEEVAERLVGVFQAPITLDGRDVRMEASIGLAIHHGRGGTASMGSELVRRADAAMYRAKKLPGTRYTVAEPAEERSRPARLERETRLRKALEEGRVRTYYQPIYDLGSGRIRGVEALARWREPDLGEVSPGSFIPLAEETGLIVALGEQQLERACARLLEEEFADPSTGDPLRLHVNLSARQLEDPDVVERVRGILREVGYPAAALCLEITESAAMRQPEAVEQLTDVGVRLAIDDFGTRYSTLSQLRRLRVDALKIDRTFVDGLPGDAKDRAIVETILTLGRTLGLEVVAEGIEREEQLAMLRELGCDEAQGFHLARPQPAEELRELLARERA